MTFKQYCYFALQEKKEIQEFRKNNIILFMKHDQLKLFKKFEEYSNDDKYWYYKDMIDILAKYNSINIFNEYLDKFKEEINKKYSYITWPLEQLFCHKTIKNYYMISKIYNEVKNSKYSYFLEYIDENKIIKDL